jgi:hypothetical protein
MAIEAPPGAAPVGNLTFADDPPTFAIRWIDLGSLATRVKKAK